MPRADEFLFLLHPRNRASEVSADCRKHDQVATAIFSDVNRLLCDGLAPAIALLNGPQLLHRSIEVLKFIHASNVRPRPLRGASQYRMHSETHQRNGEDRSDRCASCGEQTGKK